MTAILLAKAVVELLSPGGVAAPEQKQPSEQTNLPLARTPDGAPHVPATSLAGSLRDHLGEQATTLMGSPPAAEQITPSPLRLLGTHVEPTGTTHRTRTAVDRHRGAAAVGPLRRSEYLHPGSRITVYLQLDDPSLHDELLNALTSWTPTVGGERTTGHGRAAVVELRRRVIDLDTPHGRRTWLTGGGPELFADTHTEPVSLPDRPEAALLLRLRWEIVDGLHIWNGDSGANDGEGPNVSRVLRDHHDRPYVPGSTWKGVIRTRCEFILRSLGADSCAPQVSLDENDDHPSRPACGSCLICTAFGCTGAEQEQSRRGLLTFTDSPIDDAQVIDQPHVALDRVFGGARESHLFTHQVVQAGHLTLDVHADTNTAPEIAALLTLACHDLHHGFVGVGAATTRGLGTLRLLDDPDELAAQRSRALATLTHSLGAAAPGDVPAAEEMR